MQRNRARDGLTAAIYAKLAGSVLDMEHDRALRDAEQSADFPAGLAFGGPAQAFELARGQAYFGRR